MCSATLGCRIVARASIRLPQLEDIHIFARQYCLREVYPKRIVTS